MGLGQAEASEVGLSELGGSDFPGEKSATDRKYLGVWGWWCSGGRGLGGESAEGVAREAEKGTRGAGVWGERERERKREGLCWGYTSSGIETTGFEF